MKKSEIIELKDMSDSREVLSELPHRSMSWFIYLLITLITAAVVWAFIGEIDYYVSAQGSVRPNEPISTIRNTYTGRVAESHIEEGVPVARGELLFRIDTDMQSSLEISLSRQYDTISTHIACLVKFRESVIAEINLFDISNESESEYYYRYEKYVTDRDLAVEQLRHANMDFRRVLGDANAALSNANTDRSRYASQLQAWYQLKDSIAQGSNLVSESSGEQYSRYLDFEMNLRRFDVAIVQLEQAVERAQLLLEAGGASQRDLESARYDLDVAMIDRGRYVNETIVNIEQNIRSLEMSIGDLEGRARSANATISAFSGMGYDEALMAEKHRLDALTMASDAIFSLQNSLNAIYTDLSQVRHLVSEASVYAPINGVVNLYTEIVAGDYIQAGMEIATIIPETDGTMKVQIAILNADIAEIQVGQEVRYRFPALPYSDYGEISGQITKISSDARYDSGGNSYFLIEGELFGNSLTDRNGSEEALRVGMAAEVRVITKTQKIIYWVLDKLNFLDQ